MEEVCLDPALLNEMGWENLEHERIIEKANLEMLGREYEEYPRYHNVCEEELPF